MSAKFDWVLFDLDGTLTEPAEGITNSVKYALKKMGREIPDMRVLLQFIGPPLLDSFLSLGMNEAQAWQAISCYREYFSTKGLYENKVYAGVPEMLSSLKAAGVRLAVATSKPEEFAVKIAKRYSLYEYFDFIGGATMQETRTKKSEVIEYVLRAIQGGKHLRCVMVGDRKHDAEGAAACGLKCIGVLFGYGSREELTAAGCVALAETPKDVLRYIL